MRTHYLPLCYRKSKVYPSYAFRPGAISNTHLLDLPLSRTYFHRSRVVLAIEVLLIWMSPNQNLSFAWSFGVQLVIFLCSSNLMVLFDTPEIFMCHNMLFLSSPHLRLIIDLSLEWFVSCVDLL